MKPMNATVAGPAAIRGVTVSTTRALTRLARQAAPLWLLAALVLDPSGARAQAGPAVSATPSGGGSSAGQATCYGRWFDPIKDVCWECIFPISIGGFSFDNGQEDIENPQDPECFCPIPLPPYYRVGLEIGFWEPSRLIEVTRTPYCFPEMGGLYMSGREYKPPHGRTFAGHDKVVRDSFYQAHMYINVILYYLELVVDEQCAESGSFDLAYMTEYDAAWHDDRLTAIIEPEAPYFANLLAIAACSADCVAACVGFGIRELYWCSGCNGPVYPMNGNVTVHVGGVQASSLVVHRLLAKLHRLMIAWQWHGAGAMCGGPSASTPPWTAGARRIPSRWWPSSTTWARPRRTWSPCTRTASAPATTRSWARSAPSSRAGTPTRP
jgi:conjugal transfer pilus assembly protein TraU